MQVFFLVFLEAPYGSQTVQPLAPAAANFYAQARKTCVALAPILQRTAFSDKMFL